MKHLKKIMIHLGAIFGAATLITVPIVACSKSAFNKFVNELRKHPEYQGVELNFASINNVPEYTIHNHVKEIGDQLKSVYSTSNQIRQISQYANTNIKIEEKNGHTFIPAADVDSSQGTNYDAIWVRDSIWGYYALAAQHRTDDAKKVLLSLLDYFTSQKERIDADIQNPELLNDPKNGQMNAVHIRFDGDSPTFADVQENGKAQPWNHKQNDALGLFLDCLLTSVKTGAIVQADLNVTRMNSIVGLIEYLYKIEFWQMEDSGAWEEAQRLNTSSVGIVTSAIENFLDTSTPALPGWFIDSFNAQATALGYSDVDVTNRNNTLTEMKNNGYDLIHEQISLGGESPNYATNDKRYRTADAALLNLIFPAKLSGLSIAEKETIYDIVSTLNTEWGVKRYNDDNYQSGNFWFNQIKTDTDDSSIDKREKDFIKGSEASWFFDSWMAYDAIALANLDGTKKDYYLASATMHFNKSLAFITGDGLHGDGTACEAGNLVESYNAIVDGKFWWRVPSPIDPLNWAKGLFFLMVEQLTSYYDS